MPGTGGGNPVRALRGGPARGKLPGMDGEPPLIEQLTPRLRRCGNVYELDGEPLRKVVGRAPKADRLTQLDQLNANLRDLLSDRWPEPDAWRVRKAVGKAR